jgi:hypothetical protein
MHQCPEILYWKKSWNCCNLNATALHFAGGGGFCKNDSRLYREEIIPGLRLSGELGFQGKHMMQSRHS